jgi:hypothetical protein
MPEPLAAAYLQIGTTVLRERGPKPKYVGRSVRWDRLDLDRWSDALDGQPLTAGQAESEATEVERRFLEKRRG